MKRKPNSIKNVDNISRESGRKERILNSAIKIFGEKGFQNATIAEIAKDVGIGDATIYEYFKNKEDLLLTIPVEITKELIPQINDHMMGIKGALNKLRKFILIKHGFRKFVLIMSHDGNLGALYSACEELSKQPDVRMLLINWLPYLRSKYTEILKSKGGGHGGKGKTARVLASIPELVHMDRAQKGPEEGGGRSSKLTCPCTLAVVHLILPRGSEAKRLSGPLVIREVPQWKQARNVMRSSRSGPAK